MYMTIYDDPIVHVDECSKRTQDKNNRGVCKFKYPPELYNHSQNWQVENVVME